MQTERRVNLKINYAEVQLLLDKSQKKPKIKPTSEQNCPPENSEERTLVQTERNHAGMNC